MKAGRKSGVPKEVTCFKGVLNLEVRRPKIVLNKWKFCFIKVFINLIDISESDNF